MNWMIWLAIGCFLVGFGLIGYALMVTVKRSDEWLERKWIDGEFDDLVKEAQQRNHERFLREQAQRSDGGQDD